MINGVNDNEITIHETLFVGLSINGLVVYMVFFLRFGYFGNLIEDIFQKRDEKRQEQEEEINESLMVDADPDLPNSTQIDPEQPEPDVIIQQTLEQFLTYFTLVHKLSQLKDTFLSYGHELKTFMRKSKKGKRKTLFMIYLLAKFFYFYIFP